MQTVEVGPFNIDIYDNLVNLTIVWRLFDYLRQNLVTKKLPKSFLICMVCPVSFAWYMFLFFFQADNLVNIVDVDSTSIVLSHRLNPLNSPPVEKLPSNHLTLQEILIMGNCCDQVYILFVSVGIKRVCKY